MSAVKRIQVWLDCDPGHDDAFAILFAAYHPSLHLLGISTTHGNSSVDHTTLNALSILAAIGCPDIPVYAGASKPLVRPACHAPDIHGESGLDGTDLLPEPAVQARTDVAAADALAEALLATEKGESWLIATGTLTNIALAFQSHPSLVKHLGGLSIMGGAVGNGFTSAPLGTVDNKTRFGNWTPYAEFNIVADPEAADFLFRHEDLAKKITLVTLDLSHQVLATEDVMHLILKGKDGKGGPSRLRVMLVELLQFFKQTYASVFGITDGPPLHDPLAVAAILDKISISSPTNPIPFYDSHDSSVNSTPKDTTLRYDVQIITSGTHEEALAGKIETGRTVVTLLPAGEEGVRIPKGVGVQEFWNVLEELVGRAETQVSRRGGE